MSRGIFKAGVLIFFITVASKIMGFIKEMLIASEYGTTYIADAYYIGLTPSTLAITFSITIGSIFLPFFSKSFTDKKRVFKFSNNVLLLFFIGTVILYVFLLTFDKLFLNFLAPGISKAAGDLSIVLLYIMFPLVFVVIVIQIYTLMLNTFNDYVQSAATILPNNLIIILYLYFFGDKYGIIGVSIVTVFAFVIQLVILYFILRKQDYSVMNNIHVWDAHSKEFLVLLLPVVISSAFSQLNAVVDRALASGLAEGAIAALLYAYRLRGIATGLFITPIITLTFPKLAKVSNDRNDKEIATVTHNSLVAILLLLAPLTLIFMIFSREIIEVLLERGNFNNEATEMTASVFWAYSFGITAIGFREVAVRTFFSCGDTRTPTYIMITGSIVNAILSYFFVKLWGIVGLGLSASGTIIITTIIIIVSLKKKVSTMWSPSFVYTAIKIFMATIIAGIVTIYLKQINIFDFSYFSQRIDQIIILSLYSLLIGILFIAVLIVFKEKESINFLKKIITRKVRG